MGDPRTTARELAHELLKLGGFVHLGAACPNWCDLMTTAIEADRAASDAREDRLMEALERAGGSFNGRCGACDQSLEACDAQRTDYEPIHVNFCAGRIARRALAAVPPGSDR